MSGQLEPSYQQYINLYWQARPSENDTTLTATVIYADQPGTWNQQYLTNLFRLGLMITENQAWLLFDDPRYPDGKPQRALEFNHEEDNIAWWTPEALVIFRD